MTEVISEATDYFEDKIIVALIPQKELDTYNSILDLIKKDSTIAEDHKNYLISLYEANEIGEFLSQTFLYALQKDNKSLEQTSTTNISPTASITDDVNKLTELLAAYADEEGVPQIEKNNLENYPKYKKTLQDNEKTIMWQRQLDNLLEIH